MHASINLTATAPRSGQPKVTGCSRCSHDTPHAPLATLPGRPGSLPNRWPCLRFHAVLLLWLPCLAAAFGGEPVQDATYLQGQPGDRRTVPIQSNATMTINQSQPHKTPCYTLRTTRACAEHIQCMLCHHHTAPRCIGRPCPQVHKGNQTDVRQCAPRHGLDRADLPCWRHQHDQ